MAPTRPSHTGKKKPLKISAQTSEIASASADALSSTSSGAFLIATADLQRNTLIGDAKQGNATDVDRSLSNGHINGIYSCARPVQVIAKKALPTALAAEEAKNRNECVEQKWTLSAYPRVKPYKQLKSWRDLRRCDENEGLELSAIRDTIKSSIEHSSSGFPPAFPSVYGIGSVQSQNSRTIVNGLLGTPRDEEIVSISTFSAPRLPEWRHRVPSVVPTMGDETVRNGLGASELAVMAAEPAGIQLSLGYGPRRSALQSGKRMILSLDEPSFKAVIGSPLPPTSSYAYTAGKPRFSARNSQPAVNNENARVAGPRTTPNRIETTRDQAVNGLNPLLLPFNPGFTQAVLSAPNNRPMGHHPSRLFPFPDYNGNQTTQVDGATPSIPSTARVANDLSTLPTPRNHQTEYEITGYHRGDPAVLWADEMPSAIAPPSERHAASHLLGNGFLATLSLDSPSSTNEITFVEPNAPSTLPSELLTYLNGKNERIRLHAEGDVWRAEHAAEVVQRHEEQFFARRAEEGDWGLKEWHMSGEYHGQSSGGKGRGGGFSGYGGRSAGRSGRGRGRGGFVRPIGIGRGY